MIKNEQKPKSGWHLVLLVIYKKSAVNGHWCRNRSGCLTIFTFGIRFRIHYRPQQSCGKVMFLHLSVILSTGGMSASVHAGIHTPHPPPPLGRHPHWTDTPHWQTAPWADSPQADTPGQTPPSPPPKADGYCRGRYASYWNAFLFFIFFLLKMSKFTIWY